ncbi:MAG TPA: TetR family transcriptional regulator [Nakamurella sp.]|nr:TetR family transcriptional regulator [Nakamurella sp.]
MPPDSTDTRRRLLDAAFEEFAAHGLAGARVDRIAELGKANKRLIYAYYGNKEELFDTVMVRSLGVLTDAVPFSAEDLPGYAGALFDHMIAHPAMVRLTMWKLLERPDVSPEETEAYRPKVAAVADAQSGGRLAPDDDPVDVMMLVIGLVASWFTNSPALHALAGGDRTEPQRVAEHRAALVRAVGQLAAQRP